jgi:predicted membrane protein
MRNDIDSPGFTAPNGRALGNERRTVALAELVAIVGLALSTIVAATVVSVGIARANVVGNVIDNNVIDNEGSLFTVALLLGLIFIAMGGLTAFTLPGHKPKKH